MKKYLSQNTTNFEAESDELNPIQRGVNILRVAIDILNLNLSLVNVKKIEIISTKAVILLPKI